MLLRQLLPTGPGGAVPALFILGAPRTGSTVLYQALVETFRLPYIANLTNDLLFSTPIVGLCIQAGLRDCEPVQFNSHFGKTEGLLQPSEGSSVMCDWFGGGHPSQTVSGDALPDKEHQIRATFAAAHALFAKPLVIKNAWNCFRVPALAKLLPRANFIWIRRDIGAAAKSDLHARYATKGSAEEWNSATPHNVESLRLRPYWEQVVENQYEFSIALERDLNAHANGRILEFWYEDFCSDPSGALRQIAEAWPSLGAPADFGERRADVQRSAERWSLPGDDSKNIDSYLQANTERFQAMRYDSGRSGPRARGVVPIQQDGWHLRRVTRESLDEYLRTDWVGDWLTGNSRAGDESLTSQRWLVESPAKRHIFADLYGDLFRSSGRRVLDVGGGLSAFTRELASRHEYEVVELLAHEPGERAGSGGLGNCKLHHCDWLDLSLSGRYDVIVANDLLPNVDQRVELFLKKFTPWCHELRLSLTFFDEPRYYRTRRTDGDEILFMLAWTWGQVGAVLERVGGRGLAPQLCAVQTPSPSVFPNRRQVVLLTVRNEGPGEAQRHKE